VPGEGSEPDHSRGQPGQGGVGILTLFCTCVEALCPVKRVNPATLEASLDREE